MFLKTSEHGVANTTVNPLKKLVLILGDQLQDDSAAFIDHQVDRDEVIMIESVCEAQYVWSHKARIALFLSAMRHFANKLKSRGFRLTYVQESQQSIVEVLEKYLKQGAFTHLVCVEPGEMRLKNAIELLTEKLSIELDMRSDTHFYCSIDEFRDWAGDKKELRLEYFYRYMRKKHHILMQENGEPEGGCWNFDQENRKPYSKNGPGLINDPVWFEPDELTQEVMVYVEHQYPDHPGSLKKFAWPVTREEALEAMHHFVNHRLEMFGAHQDAMWTQTPFGWHSVISSSLNLKLISPRELIGAVLEKWQGQTHLLSSVEGYIRQVIGWREFVRGMYYLDMPKMAIDNYYDHQRKLPKWYWTGQTKMACMKDAISQTLEYGYAHHIQRLMITGNFALLAEMLPQEVCDWYLAVYVDAIEWVELPNTAGMALFANGGRFTSKPYVASGAYVKRMSNYCQSCAYKSDVRYGEQACPMTNLYWNFLLKHQAEFEKNPRTKLMVINLKKIDPDEQTLIRNHAQKLLNDLDSL